MMKTAYERRPGAYRTAVRGARVAEKNQPPRARVAVIRRPAIDPAPAAATTA